MSTNDYLSFLDNTILAVGAVGLPITDVEVIELTLPSSPLFACPSLFVCKNRDNVEPPAPGTSRVFPTGKECTSIKI